MIVVYGDCGTGGRLDEVLERYPAVRPAGVHCFQWYAGELYRRFESDIGIYFLTDWLVTNWERAVIKGLGLDRFPWLHETYFGNLTRVLFVRQHPDPAREAKAREIAGMGKPLEIHDLGIEPRGVAAAADGGDRRCSSLSTRPHPHRGAGGDGPRDRDAHPRGDRHRREARSRRGSCSSRPA